MSMSFGRPNLLVRDPHVTKTRSRRFREFSSYRRITVKGEWWLWILCAHWRLTISPSIAATGSSSLREKNVAITRLDGQRLTGMTIDSITGFSEFVFDLGAKLQVRRFTADDSDIWTLYKPNGYVLGIRGDGTYTHGKGTTPADEIKPARMKKPNQPPEPTAPSGRGSS
jgi:hypothetical protein